MGTPYNIYIHRGTLGYGGKPSLLVQNFALLVGLSQGLDKVQIQLNKN